MRKRTVLILLMTCGFFGTLNGLTSGADFLKIPRSARAIALGDSYTSIIGDVTAIEYNPAAMNTLQNFAVSAMYQNWIDDSYALYLSGAFKFYSLVLGGSFLYLDYGGIDEYGAYGELINTYKPFDMNIKVAASLDGGVLFNFLAGFSVGATLSIVERKLIEDNSVGLSMDLGVNYQTTLGRLQMVSDGHFEDVPINAGFAVQNLGFAASGMTPVKGTLGLSVEPISNLMVSMDTAVEYGRPFVYKMGVEYTLFEMVILRTGFNLGKDSGNLNFGVGIQYDKFLNKLRLDYAFSYMGILGNNHNISVYADFPIFVNEVDRLYQKGIYYYVRGDYDLAREMWEKAIAIDPDNKLINKKLEELERFEEMNDIID